MVTEAGGKKTKATKSVNPDVRIEDFLVMVDDEYLDGITISSCSYKNNQKPTFIDHNEKYMYVNLSVKYDMNDPAVKAALSRHKKLKSAISQMLRPRYVKHGTGDDTYYEWTYEPIEIRIDQIELSESTPVYTTQEYDSDETVRTKSGILVCDSKAEKKTFWKKSYKDGEGLKKTIYVPTKVELPGLRYQIVYDLGDGNKVVRQIPLRPGKYSIKNVRTGEGFGPAAIIATKSFDYYEEDPDVLSEAEKDDYVQLSLNDKWEDWAVSTGYGRYSYRANAGFFKGKLPNFNSSK